MESHEHASGAPRPTPEQAAHDLELLEQPRAAAAARVSAPRGYYAVLGVASGGLVLALSAGSQAWGKALAALAAALTVGCLFWYQRRTGTAPSIDLRVPGVWRYALLVTVFAAGLLLALLTRDWRWALPAAVVVASTSAVLGRRFDADVVRSRARGR